MGVTLERVQNKFACIIGELCSEPVILSQFAIWVDLRIAEYKAKGAISLDCSGDEPEPIWLNGHRLPKPQRNDSRERIQLRTPLRKSMSRPLGHTSFHSTPSSNYPSSTETVQDQGFLGEARLSPNLAVVKDEPSDEPSGSGVFPMSMHAHGPITPTRKRPATETISQSDNSGVYQQQQQHTPVHSPSKVQRLSSTGDSPHPGDTTSNQSLMSIISGDIEEQNQASGDLNDHDIDIILDYESKNTREDNSSITTTTPVLPEPSSSSADIGDSFSQDNSSNAEFFTPKRNSHGLRDLTEQFQSQATIPWHDQPVYRLSLRDTRGPQYYHNIRMLREGIQAKIPNVRDKTPATVRNLVNAVFIFEQWLSTNFCQEARPLTAIPPSEMDLYLEDFFSKVKKPCGEDYDAVSYGNLRSNISRFLEDNGYGHSLSVSSYFSRSQKAYRIRRKMLRNGFMMKRQRRKETEEGFLDISRDIT